MPASSVGLEVAFPVMTTSEMPHMEGLLATEVEDNSLAEVFMDVGNVCPFEEMMPESLTGPANVWYGYVLAYGVEKTMEGHAFEGLHVPLPRETVPACLQANGGRCLPIIFVPIGEEAQRGRTSIRRERKTVTVARSGPV